MHPNHFHLNKPDLTQEHQLSTLVENQTKFSLNNCEFSIYETHQSAYDVKLHFEHLAFTGMLRGKKWMKLQDKTNYFEYLPQVSYAAGILNSVFTGNNRIAATDHLTISDIDPDKFDLIFVLCAETTFKIRPIINQFREKVVLIHTSVEPGLEEYNNYFFPH